LALPHLVKYVYNNGTDEVIKRGKKIQIQNYVDLIEHDELMGNATFRVKDDVYNSFYKVYVEKYADAKNMHLRCTCPYNIGEICRHEAAALMRLQDMVDKNLIRSSAIQYNQLHAVAKMKHIDLKMIKLLSSPLVYSAAEEILRNTVITIISAANERVEALLTIKGEEYPLVIQKNDDRNFDTSCKCNDTMHPICQHKVALFLQLLNNHGADYFDSIRNWDREKNKLLAIYGYSLSDDLTGKFEFIYKEGKPYLKVLDTTIKRVNAPVLATPKSAHFDIRAVEQKKAAEKKEEVAVETKNTRLGVVFNFNAKTFPYFSVDAMVGEANEDNNKFISKVEKLDLTKYVETNDFTEEDKQLFQLIRKMQDAEVNKYLNRNSPFSGIWENIIQTDTEELPAETKQLILEYLHPKVKKMFDEQSANAFVYILPKTKAFKTENLKEVTLNNSFLQPTFTIATQGKNGFVLQSQVKLNGIATNVQDNSAPSNIIFLQDDVMYTWLKTEDLQQIENLLGDEKVELTKHNWKEQMAKTILPLTKMYNVEFDKSLVTTVKTSTPDIKLMLQERGDYLLFQPIFVYNHIETRPSDGEIIYIPDGERILQIKKNVEAEQSFFLKLKNLHSGFADKYENGSLVLKGAEVLKNNWFFLFIDAMKDMKVPVYGFEALKNFRFNTAKPSTQIHVTSGVDWFDAKVEIEFGEQKVGIAEIKNALAEKRSFVQLTDGTLGILPDEWLKKYSLLFKVGDGRTDKLRLSKFHLSVIDDLYENRNEQELSFKLDEKYERLRSFKNIPETPAPEHLEPILRPYQVAGFQWLNYLNEVGWGGILADDMGLGKTIQALTMLHQFKVDNEGLMAIVICPTTLIYNWQNETKKFAPDLSVHIHHGGARTRSIEELTKANIIITTYGTLRSDIQLLLKIKFDYVVLDESQAIKNPSSKVTKAACLLNATNRVCMSGTPLQNNTFDLFAQMNFLNPGLLGSMEFFRNEFANPIDKFGDQEPKEHLRKLLYPFILRRTKEQVAKDLPEKTEQILFCEMEKEQRKIYDAYRNSYREKILGSIDDVGIGRSQLTILQGLMKLRQICDSPAILNEEEKFPNHSIKLDELTREITENIGEHKALVFSQFLGMLALIKEKLIADNIPFEYFDGGTSATDREKAITNFQNNTECRVFLISLKAGGVGLNLTAADYVYLVDPWWNPAVEQQAIDRTHRIGQTKNIFAYRMICIDTIEDKILQLQERKKQLAKDLIADDANFVKALTKQDVEYLFS
jgi:uncharacterized Zn finger protein